MRNSLRNIFVLALLALVPMRICADGWTPTDAGLVVDLKQGDQFLLSVWIDLNSNGTEEAGEEFFVCDYAGYSGGRFNYGSTNQPNDPTKNYLKLVPQASNAMEPSAASIWTVDTALNRVFTENGVTTDYALGGIAYTMRSAISNTLYADGGWKMMGALSNATLHGNLCDVVFTVPTVQALTNMDPNNTFDKGDRNRGTGDQSWAFDGKMGTGFLGMTYREVYWFELPRDNKSRAYTNAAMVGFNTTLSNMTVRSTTISKGRAYWIYKTGYDDVKRMVFRLYIYQGHQFQTCPNTYFFAHEEQDYVKYRWGDPKNSKPAEVGQMTDSTTARKIYTTDHHHCMERVGTSKYYQTEGFVTMFDDDSTYYYIGKNNKYRNSREGVSLGSTAGAYSQFRKIRQMRIRNLANAAQTFIPAPGTCGRVVVDTTSGAENLGATFDPAGYFFHTNSGMNVKMRQEDDSTWITDEMWYIEGDYMLLSGKVLLYTEPEFSETDPGTEIDGWSAWQAAPDIPVVGHPTWTAAHRSGWARIHTNRATQNGGIEFVLANTDMYIQYHNNGHFGADIPNQYATEDNTIVNVKEAQLLAGYDFAGWNTAENGSGTTYLPGATVDLSSIPEVDGKRVLHLYAQATYNGSINVAISFLKEDGKRYFLTPSGSAPRYGRPRHFEDWTNTWQGMGDGTNSDPNYLSTFKLIGSPTCVECEPNEYVLDPHRVTQHGSEDSLVFWENNQPDPMEYIGLYYTTVPTTINTVIVNNSWAGLFTSTEGWPTAAQACIDSTRIASDYYLEGWPDNVRKKRAIPADPEHPEGDSIWLPNEIKYIPATNQFDGAAKDAGTDFMISGVGVVDAHYVIIPDTTDAETPWTESITFGFHEDQETTEDVWSKLIGKQLLAQMKVGEDTVFFHPNDDKTLNTASGLRLSRDYRLTHAFSYIRDARVEALGDAVTSAVKPTYAETDNAFHCTITSGENSPMNVQSGGNYIDIVDTLRVWLRPAESSRIKGYYGRWKTGAEGLHVKADGSRYRDILVTTKTYHYGPEQTEYRLVPDQESYNFGSLDGVSENITFTLQSITSHRLLDVEGNFIREEIISTDTIEDKLNLTSSTCTLKEGDTYFTIGTKTATGVQLTTKIENTTNPKMDTLTVTTAVTINSTPIELTAKVPLLQVSTQGTELIWSVDYNGTRYFIFATSTGLRYQTFATASQRLVRGNNELIKGAGNADNSDLQYITPWSWTDVTSDQLTLRTEYGVNRYFHISGAGVPGVDAAVGNASSLRFEFADTYTNSNGNYEEIVYLQYGADRWLQFNGTALVLVENKAEASLFSWAYMLPEYNLLNNGTYPSLTQEEFGYNSSRTGSVQTRYKAYLDHSMLLNNQLVYLCKTNEEDIADLIDADKEWKTNYTATQIYDSRFADNTSGLSISTDPVTLTTTISQAGSSPLDKMYNGQYVNIVDTLDFRIGLQTGAPVYRFKDWDGVSTLEDAHVKIPLIRRTYHEVSYDSIACYVTDYENNHAFPATLRAGVSSDSIHVFNLRTERHTGRNVYNVSNQKVSAIRDGVTDVTSAMNLTDVRMAEIRLVDEYGNKPAWCDIIAKGLHSITVKCYSNGIRSPRVAYIYLAYIIMVDDDNNPSTPDVMKFVNYRLTVSQASLFEYANNQTLYHSAGASGDPKMDDGRQHAHENKRILYYYNPRPYNEPDQDVELPVRERGFYGWWRWYREGLDQNGVDVSDSDIPDSVIYQAPRNVSDNKKYKYPFRTIGDSVWVDEEDHSKGKKLVTMGRYTVFHYKAKDYNNKKDPVCKVPLIYPPHNKTTATYVVDISNYYDNLPLSMAAINQIDTAMLDTMHVITEPTLSLREVFELHPWTEMAARMESYKTSTSGPFTSENYMEDHVVMAPIGTPLLLSTEQRYDTANLYAKKHSESLLGYYMRDDNWSSWDGDENKQDTMIWCAGWDAECKWYTYNPKAAAGSEYTLCTHPINVEEDFLEVPAKGGLAGDYTDTVYYCLRARSKKSTFAGAVSTTVPGDYWFNICRYKIIYHNPNKYGPKLENKTSKKAIITNDEIEQDYEVLERLNFDYNKPGTSYQIYPHPLPWSDGSYGYTYPLTSSALPNRYHDETDFPGPGEYGIINKIPYGKWWRKIEQHGGAANGYMLYCDGMSAAGQVAALTLQTELCEGQKLYFSGYVSNASSQTGKSNPNFTFSVQGSNDGTTWEDISTYMTGDIVQADESKYTNWHQIFFPIEHEQVYSHFRVKIFNMAADVDGNDFIIDDMCIFATKPPLIAYQANTRCVEKDDRDSVIHVVLRVDYQGFTDLDLNDADVNYTVEQETKAGVKSFVPLMDGYIDPHTGTNDTIYGSIHMPAHNYEPSDNDSIFANLNLLAERFEQSYDAWEAAPADAKPDLFRKGYIYENLDGDIRPVLYVMHNAKMTADNKYTVRMSLGSKGLMDAQCAMTSELKVTNRMMLMLNGIEQDDKEVSGICGNVTHDLSLRVRGTLIQDSVAPIDLTGSCVNDWLLYGDTVEESSYKRYGYYYSDIVKVVKDILRYNPASGESNSNQFVHNLGSVNRNEMNKVKNTYYPASYRLTTSDEPYDVLANLVNNGFLTLYQSNLTVAMNPGDSMQYVIFPILGTGTDDLHSQSMEVCPTPLLIKLKTKVNINGSPMIIGGLHRDSTQTNNPIIVLADASSISSGVHIPVDSIRTLIGINQIEIVSSDDPNFSLGVHKLEMTPDKVWTGDPTDYYHKGDTMVLTPASTNTYQMRPGYTYTFEIEMVSSTGDPNDEEIGCPYGKVPFTIAYVPDYLRWNPKNAENAQWNNPENWLGVTAKNGQIHADAHFVPLPSTKVIIPSSASIYPSLPATISSKDSVQQVGFSYNICDAIRVMPNAIIGNQQYLTCDKVIVDMSIPQQTWAFRSAPVTGMVSGDLFMADADLANSNLWEAGTFDTGGRTYTTGNASFWLSVYDRETVHANGSGGGEVRDASAEWSKVTNGLTLSLPPAQGWAVYTRTKSGKAAAVRLPKNDDTYHYYSYGNIIGDEPVDRGANAGKLAFYPGKMADHQDYILTNGTASTLFTFGNPTMAYIDIWGFIHDNALVEEISYLNASGTYTVVTKSAAEATQNKLSNVQRYLPPMQAIMVKVAEAATSKSVTLNTNRIVTSVSQVVRPLSAPKRNTDTGISKGIMTITATNPASPLCTSQLLLGQGYNDAILTGEDAVLTTINIDKFSTSTPTTPFTLYAAEDGYGLSIDLRDSIVNVPLSFHMSNLSFAPMTYLWFTGVHTIDGPLYLYDALTDTERLIMDGICLEIETPAVSHEKRYYIRRRGTTQIDDNPTTEVEPVETADDQAVKILYHGQVLILRQGHVYTIFGQKIR